MGPDRRSDALRRRARAVGLARAMDALVPRQRLTERDQLIRQRAVRPRGREQRSGPGRSSSLQAGHLAERTAAGLAAAAHPRRRQIVALTERDRRASSLLRSFRSELSLGHPVRCREAPTQWLPMQPAQVPQRHPPQSVPCAADHLDRCAIPNCPVQLSPLRAFGRRQVRQTLLGPAYSRALLWCRVASTCRDAWWCHDGAVRQKSWRCRAS